MTLALETNSEAAQVKSGSPGDKAGLVAYFDYIVSANGVPLTVQNSTFVEILHGNVDKSVPVVVYNSKTEQSRETAITPSSAWDPQKKELLGISIRFCNIKDSTEYVWHVLEVFPNSPASEAGLQAFSDYVVGSSSLVFQSSEDFFNLVTSNMGRALEFFVYNSDTDKIRTVTLTPNKEWGGSGSLGCNVAYGLLHKIPTRSRQHGEDSDQEALPQPQSLPSSVSGSLPQVSVSATTRDTNPQMTSTTTQSPVIDTPAPVSPQPILHKPEPSPVSPVVNDYRPPPARLPVNIAASAPNVSRPQELPQANVPLAQSTARVVAPPGASNLEELKRKQLALQQQLQRLRESQNKQ